MSLFDGLEGVDDDLSPPKGSLRHRRGGKVPSTTVESVVCLRETAKGLLLKLPSGREEWVAKSNITGGEVLNEGDAGSIMLPSWVVSRWDDSAVDDESPDQTAVSIAGCVGLTESSKAVQVRLPDGRELWFPRSQLDKASEVTGDRDSGVLVITSWIAEQKGLRTVGG